MEATSAHRNPAAQTTLFNQLLDSTKPQASVRNFNLVSRCYQCRRHPCLIRCAPYQPRRSPPEFCWLRRYQALSGWVRVARQSACMHLLTRPSHVHICSQKHTTAIWSKKSPWSASRNHCLSSIVHLHELRLRGRNIVNRTLTQSQLADNQGHEQLAFMIRGYEKYYTFSNCHQPCLFMLHIWYTLT